MSKLIDIAGQRFNRLIVIEFSRLDKNGAAHWKCKCDCGNETIVSSNNLKRGGTKSCGCLRKETGRLSEGEAACNAVIRSHKRHAKERNLEQALTNEQIITLHKENCHYCGAPPSNKYFRKNLNGSYVYNGIDRIDNNKGYTIDNVVSCCENCNYSKRQMTYDEFLTHIKQIYLHRCQNS